MAELEAALAAALRSQQRQVAPFRRDRAETSPTPEPANLNGEPAVEKTSGPRRPGRKGGHKASNRPRLTPNQFREVLFPRDLEGKASCPDCNAWLFNLRSWGQQVVDLPDADCVVTDVTLESGTCPRCRADFTTLNPLTGSSASGAAAVQFGPRLLALAALLHHERAVPMEPVAELFGNLTGLSIETSALVRAMHRLADHATPQYVKILEQVRISPHVGMDESGWRVNGDPASVHVAVARDATLYKITSGRASDIPAETLGPDFRGVLSSDGSLIYENLPCSARQTCLQHLARHAKAAEKVADARGKAFPRKVRAWIRAAIELRAGIAALSVEEAQRAIGDLKDELLDMSDGPNGRYTYENQGLANYMYNRQDFWLTFLEQPGIDGLDGTNNAAERALRPIVRCRKVSGGSRSWRGAETHAILASVIRTHRQRGLDPEHEIVTLLRPARPWIKRPRHPPAATGR